MMTLSTLAGLALILPLVVKLIVVHTRFNLKKGLDIALIIACIFGLVIMIAGWLW